MGNNAQRPIHVATHLYKLYNEDNVLLGTTQLDLPEIAMLTTEVKGADVAGAIDMPIIGLVSAMSTKFNLRTVTKDAAKLMDCDRQHLECRIAIQVVEDGKHIFKQHKFIFEGFFKNLTPGKISVGETQDRALDFETIYFKEIFDNEELLEVDKLNLIYKVMGVDKLEAARQATE